MSKQQNPSQTASNQSPKLKASPQKRKQGKPDYPCSEAEVIDFLDSLERVRLGDSYSSVDRARDFMAVFGGESNRDQGQRVLAQLVKFCTPTPNPAHADRAGTLAFKEGRRWVLAELVRAFMPKSRIPDEEKVPND